MFNPENQERKSPEVRSLELESRTSSAPSGLNLLKEEDKMNRVEWKNWRGYYVGFQIECKTAAFVAGLAGLLGIAEFWESLTYRKLMD